MIFVNGFITGYKITNILIQFFRFAQKNGYMAHGNLTVIGKIGIDHPTFFKPKWKRWPNVVELI